MQIVPYLAGGLTAFLAMDIVPIPSPTAQFGAVRAAISAPAPVLGTLGSSVNRAAKSDRGPIVHSAQGSSSSAMKPGPIKEIKDQARDEKPRPTRGPRVPVGCEPSFSPVAAPSLAHHTGRCVARLETLWTVG